MNWQALPFVRLLAPLLAGICLADQYLESVVPEGLPVALIGSLLLLWIWQGRPLTFRRRHFFGIALLLMLTGLGVIAVRHQDPLRSEKHFSRHLVKPVVLAGVIRGVRPGATRHRLLVRVVAQRSAERGWQPVDGRLLVYQPGASLEWGDTLLWKASVRRIPGPLNPEAFDFATYMRRQGVLYQDFLKAGDFRVRPYQGGGGWMAWANRLQASGLQILQQHLADSSAYGVAAALVLGHRNALDADLRDAYAAAGAIHILAVSGLHVGLVYLALSSLLRFLPGKGIRRRLLEMLLQLAGIWGFVLVAGLPASAVRAAAMFSFFTLGRTLYREASVYNILAASAFCMLLIDARQLFQVGFQLSYFAVIGIVSWHDRIYRSWFPPHPVLAYAWKLTSLSLAAQLATFPLSVYYFNQFPVLFWLSGWIAVPAAGFILGGGLLLIILAPLGGLPSWVLGRLLHHLLTGVNASIRWISELPASYIKGLWLESVEVWLIYLLMVTLSLFGSEWARTGRRRALMGGLALAVCFGWAVVRAGIRWQQFNQRQVVIYRTVGSTLVDVVAGRQCWPVQDTSLQPAAVSFAAQRYRWSRNVTVQSERLLQESGGSRQWRYRGGLLQYGYWKMLTLGPSIHPAKIPPISVDLLLIRGNPDWSLADLSRSIKADTIVLDASNTASLINRWRRACRRSGQTFLSIRDEGGLVVSIPKPDS